MAESILDRLPPLHELEAALGRDLRERELLRKLVKVLREHQRREQAVANIQATRTGLGGGR